MADGAPVPFTVIGGFLGAGKTTLLNSLLRDADGRRFAVLVNDFGDLAVDGDLVAEHGGETLTLANGCVCCTIGDDLIATVMRLMAGPSQPEHVLIEASGVADPKPVSDIGELLPGLQRDAVVVLVDAEQIRRRAADARLSDTVERQLAAADIIVLNKCDLVDEPEQAALTAWLQGRAPGAAILPVRQAEVPPDVVLGPVDRPARAEPAEHAHRHDTVFQSRTLRWDGAIEEARLRHFLEALPDDVLRAKGFATLADGGRVLIQRTGRRLTLSPAAAGEADYLVLIGPDLPEEDALMDAWSGPSLE